MEEWKTYKMGDLFTLEYGKPVEDKDSKDGTVPVFGTNGQIGTSHLPPLCGHPSVILGRKGAYRGVHFSDSPFSVIDTAFYVEPISSAIDIKWLYYKLLTYDINSMDSGSAIPSTDRYHIYSLPIDVPPFDAQKQIVCILDSLNNKIALNNRINHNLEEQADSLISSAIKTQSIGSTRLWDICTYVTERVNCDILNYENYISTDNMLANRGGVGRASTIPYGKCTSFKARDVLVSNIRPYFKKIWRASFSGGCSNDVLCFRTTIGTNSFLYHLLRSDAFFEYVMSGANGSKMPRGDKQHIMNWEIPVFENRFLASLEGSLGVIDDRVAIIHEENRRLIAIRDSLLPNLMNNRISINDLAC